MERFSTLKATALYGSYQYVSPDSLADNLRRLMHAMHGTARHGAAWQSTSWGGHLRPLDLRAELLSQVVNWEGPPSACRGATLQRYATLAARLSVSYCSSRRSDNDVGHPCSNTSTVFSTLNLLVSQHTSKIYLITFHKYFLPKLKMKIWLLTMLTLFNLQFKFFFGGGVNLKCFLGLLKTIQYWFMAFFYNYLNNAANAFCPKSND